MSEGRLFKIMYYLLEKGRTTASALAEEFEVSVRTIYRDIDALSGAGIPIYAEAGRNGGISLMDHFVLDKVMVSEQEKKALLAALQSFSMMEGTLSKEMLTKLAALFNMQVDPWIEVDFSRWGNHADHTKFNQLKDAILQHQVIEIAYVSSYQNHSRRRIYPLRLSYKANAWYLKAYCEGKQAYRLFKCNRIIWIHPLEETFANMVYPDEEVFKPESYPLIRLQFSAHMSYRVYDEFDDKQIEKTADGKLIASAEMPQDAWLIGYILSFGNQIEILEPVSLKAIVAEEAKKIYENNKP